MKISELIGSDLITGNAADTAETVEETMKENGIHALPIVDEMGVAEGIITSTDLGADIPGDTPAAQIMSDQIFEVSPSDEARDAAKMMRDHGVHHLLVIETERVVGVVSSFDLLKVVEEC